MALLRWERSFLCLSAEICSQFIVAAGLRKLLWLMLRRLVFDIELCEESYAFCPNA